MNEVFGREFFVKTGRKGGNKTKLRGSSYYRELQRLGTIAKIGYTKIYPVTSKSSNYDAIHAWIRRHWGKPNLCENCGDKNAKRYEWANVTGIYNRERKNWKRLCKKCHILLDDVVRKVLITKKKKKRLTSTQGAW